MIHAILAFLDNGVLVFDHYFQRFELDSVYISGFTTAINQFGLRIFPDEELEDIVFTSHHIFFCKYRVVDQGIIFLLIHDKHENHLNLKKISQEIYWELKQKFSHAFTRNLIEANQLEPLHDKIDQIFQRERRHEKRVT